MDFDIEETDIFAAWIEALRDERARKRIAQRIARLQLGLLGDAKSVGDGVMEMRIDYGPGYRLYFIRRGARLVVLLCGGDKASQPRDIARAKQLAGEWE
jgi:putative addiction module killer protein